MPAALGEWSELRTIARRMARRMGRESSQHERQRRIERPSMAKSAVLSADHGPPMALEIARRSQGDRTEIARRSHLHLCLLPHESEQRRRHRLRKVLIEPTVERRPQPAHTRHVDALEFRQPALSQLGTGVGLNQESSPHAYLRSHSGARHEIPQRRTPHSGTLPTAAHSLPTAAHSPQRHTPHSAALPTTAHSMRSHSGAHEAIRRAIARVHDSDARPRCRYMSLHARLRCTTPRHSARACARFRVGLRAPASPSCA